MSLRQLLMSLCSGFAIIFIVFYWLPKGEDAPASIPTKHTMATDIRPQEPTTPRSENTSITNHAQPSEPEGSTSKALNESSTKRSPKKPYTKPTLSPEEQNNLAEKMSALKRQYDETGNLEAAYLLSQAYEDCSIAVRLGQEGLAQLIEKLEENTHNIQYQEGIEGQQLQMLQNYDQCTAYQAIYPDINFEEEALKLLTESAFSDYTPAILRLSKSRAFRESLEAMPKAKQEALKTELGERLLETRDSCSTEAMMTFVNFQQEGKNWNLPIDVPRKRFQYAHYWMMVAIKKHVEQADETVVRLNAENLNTWSQKHELSKKDIAVATKKAKQLFRKFCTE